MRIAIDCRTILNPGPGEAAGVGMYTLHLVEYLLRLDATNEYVLFVDGAFPTDALRHLIGGRPKTKAVRLPSSTYRRFLPGVYSELLVSSAFHRERPDILHVPGGRIPISYRGTTVLTVHDLAIFRNPEWFPKQQLASRILYPKTIAQASALIAVSNATRHDLETYFAVPHGHVTVIPEGVRSPFGELPSDVLTPDEVRERHDLARFFQISAPYILSISTIEPRKNFNATIHAFDTLLREGTLFHDLELVIAGKKGWHSDSIFALIEEKNLLYKKKYGKEKIRYLGYISEHTKWTLLRHTRAFVFPSFYEGFGLPVLEAMAAGTPVITSKTSSLPEVAGDAALFVDPQSVASIATALRTILLDKTLAETLAERGRTQAAQFTWEKTAKATQELYEITEALH